MSSGESNTMALANMLALGEAAELRCTATTWSFSPSSPQVVSSCLPAASFLSLKTAITLQKEDASVADPLVLILHLTGVSGSLLGLRVLSNARFLEVYALPPLSRYDDIADPVQSGKYFLTSRGAAITNPEGLPSTATYSHDIDCSSNKVAALCLKLLSMKQPVEGSSVGPSGMICALHNLSIAYNQDPPSVPSALPVEAPSLPPRTDQQQQHVLQGARQEVQDMRERMKSLLMSPGQVPPFQLPPSNNQGIAQQLQLALAQMQATLLRDVNLALDNKLAPVMQRLDRLEQKLDSIKLQTAAKEVVDTKKEGSSTSS